MPPEGLKYKGATPLKPNQRSVAGIKNLKMIVILLQLMMVNID
jgi:hypothetical protein